MFNLGVAHLQMGHIEEGFGLIKKFINESCPIEKGHEVLKGKPLEILEEAFTNLPDTKYLDWLLQQKEIIKHKEANQ